MNISALSAWLQRLERNLTCLFIENYLRNSSVTTRLRDACIHCHQPDSAGFPRTTCTWCQMLELRVSADGNQNPRVYSAGLTEARFTFPFLSHSRRGCCRLFLLAQVVSIDGEVEWKALFSVEQTFLYFLLKWKTNNNAQRASHSASLSEWTSLAVARRTPRYRRNEFQVDFANLEQYFGVFVWLGRWIS
ncbi:Hypothetical_protein [Hexamita inflata]|uniref:Hypothetical_protein n=1 Tax=Hexamita inflata TaxID=28002 RepID=A0AA86QEW0_9EUKA|nr:Hypothetical protein HINF_LOCUS45664 [Hexamita inflata]